MLLGAAYFVVGLIFGAFAGWSASHQMRVAWRVAAWVISAAAFAAHIGYEHFRLRSSPGETALHAALAAALGAFALAVAANVHAQQVTSSRRGLPAFALVAWPALAAVPAFVVALVATAGLRRWRST